MIEFLVFSPAVSIDSSMIAICHIFLTDLKNQSRLFKELGTASKVFPADQLLTVGLDRDMDETSGVLRGKFPYRLVRLWTRKLPRKLPFQLVNFIEWSFRAGFVARRAKPTIIQCHSLPALPASVVAKIFSRSKLVYDAHELETRRANLSEARQRATELLERALMPFVDSILVVSPSIQKHYREAYPNKPVDLLMNLPSESDIGPGVDFRKNLGIKPAAKVVIYLGAIAPMRGIDVALAAAKLTPDWHFVFMGDGPLKGEIQSAGPNVHWHAPVAENQIIRTVEKADVSFCVIDCTADSYRYALPNKFFQSLIAKIPILINEQSVDMKIVGEGTGIVFPVAFSADAVSGFLQKFVPFKSANSFKLSWESQSTGDK